MLARTMAMAGAMAAGAAGAASAASYVYLFEGTCVGTCAAGAAFDGDMILGDTSFSPGGAVAQDDFLGIAFRFGTDHFIGILEGPGFPARLEATWGDAAGRLSSFTYRASSVLAPELGLTVSADLTGSGGGGLSGGMAAALAGNCATVSCDTPFMPAVSSYAAGASPQASPEPIPLPAPLALLVAGIGGLVAFGRRKTGA